MPATDFSPVVLYTQVAFMVILWLSFRYMNGKASFWSFRWLAIIAFGSFGGRYAVRLYESWTWAELMSGASAFAFWFVAAFLIAFLCQLGHDVLQRIFQRGEEKS